jgi:hypothetical protein
MVPLFAARRADNFCLPGMVHRLKAGWAGASVNLFAGLQQQSYPASCGTIANREFQILVI